MIGAAYLYSVTMGDLLHTLSSPMSTKNRAQFGNSLSALGSKLLVGVGRGVYVFDPASGEDPYVYKATVVAIGENVLVRDQYGGVDNTGRAYVLDGETCDLLFTIEHPEPEAYNYFGISVAAAGDKIAVGSDYSDKYGYHSGAAYMFEVVPEPTSMMLLLTGGLALLLRRRRFSRFTQPDHDPAE